jgi:hypothetical protein
MLQVQFKTQIDGKQAADSDLTAVAGLSTTGLIARTGSGTASTRTISAGSSKISISNGDGVSGNPSIDVAEANLTHNNIGGILSATKGGTAQSSYATGDTLYSSATDTLSKLSGNTSTTKKYLSQTGTGSASQAPAWSQPAFSELSGTASIAQGGTGQTTAQAAIDALLPTQTSNSGKFLTTNGNYRQLGHSFRRNSYKKYLVKRRI